MGTHMIIASDSSQGPSQELGVWTHEEENTIQARDDMVTIHETIIFA